jgi:hypothetical protein
MLGTLPGQTSPCAWPPQSDPRWPPAVWGEVVHYLRRPQVVNPEIPTAALELPINVSRDPNGQCARLTARKQVVAYSYVLHAAVITLASTAKTATSVSEGPLLRARHRRLHSSRGNRSSE